MGEQLDKGVSIPFVNIGTDIYKGIDSRVPLDTENNIEVLTKNTNTTNNRDFKSALELTDYDIKINRSSDRLRDTDIYSTTNNNGTHYDRKLTLKDLGQHITQRIKDSMDESETYNINLRGKLSLGWPSNETINDTFDSYKKYQLSNLNEDSTDIGNPDDFYRYSKTGYIGNISKEFMSKYCDDQSGISMGDAKVLNPDFQFNELDDVRTDFRRPKIGRLYAERIYDYNLPTMYICPGTVEIKTNHIGIVAALTKTQSENLSNYLKNDNNNPIKLGFQKFAAIFNRGIAAGAKHILDNQQWYKWVSSTTKYMQYVNEMLIELAVWMGLMDPDPSSTLLTGWTDELIEFADQNTDNGGTWLSEAVSSVENRASDAIEKIKKFFGIDENGEAINTVSSKDKGKSAMVVDGYLGSSTNPKIRGRLSAITILPQYSKNSYLSSLKLGDAVSSSSIEDILTPSELFIPFAICKGVNVSETFSNSTSEHPLAQEYNNSYEQSNNTQMIQGFNATYMTSIIDQAGKVMNSTSVSEAVTNALETSVGQKIKNLISTGDTELGMVVAGAGRFVLPEIWTNSSFDRSYSITFKFRSPYGHRLSIFENTMVPLLFLISLSLPRAVGMSSYTNPFYVKAFSKGLFSCNMGIITSLSISRGEDKNDRTFEGFFRTVTASISIKDVLPVMHMGLDLGNWSIVNSTNDSMTAYMCNLAGVDFIDRMNLLNNVKYSLRRFQTSYDELGATTRAWISSKLGGNFIGRSMKSLGALSNPMNDRNYRSGGMF